jgi:hypothetical protein
MRRVPVRVEGWFDTRCPEQVRPLLELVFPDGIGSQGVVSFQDSIDLPFQVRTQGCRKILQLEIDPGIFGPDLHPSDPALVVSKNDHIQDMRDGMVAHEYQTSVLVQNQPDGPTRQV